MASDKSIPNVEVLLATFNGEKYLTEQLDSLLAQRGVRLSMLVSDDGSSDETLTILRSYIHLFPEFRILDGPKKGPQENYFYLLSHASGEFVALCDQDDVWEPDHLANSLARLKLGVPSVTFSAVREFTTDQASGSTIWPKKIKINSIKNILFENPARGCTIVMNKSFLDIAMSEVPKNSIMHDWWIVLVAMSYKCLTASAMPEVRYRIHENNVVGPTPSARTKFRRFAKIICSGSLLTVDQLRDLYAIHASKMTPQEMKLLSIWKSPVGAQSLIKQVLSGSRYRSNLIEEVALRCTFIWIWLLERLRR